MVLITTAHPHSFTVRRSKLLVHKVETVKFKIAAVEEPEAVPEHEEIKYLVRGSTCYPAPDVDRYGNFC